jgi:hypothetical protein
MDEASFCTVVFNNYSAANHSTCRSVRKYDLKGDDFIVGDSSVKFHQCYHGEPHIRYAITSAEL